MQGKKGRQAKFYVGFSLEAAVPQDDFYRQLERVVDLSWVRGRVAHCYAAIGRPSVDPEVIVKLELIAYLENIPSERQLMREVADRLSLRRYIGYDIDEEVPDHSTLSKARDLLGRETFQAVFDHSVRLCQGAGMVGGLHLSGDKSIVKANASLESLEPRLVHESPQAFVERLYAADAPGPGEAPPGQVSDLTARPGYPQALCPGETGEPSWRGPSPVKPRRRGRGGKGRVSNATHVSRSDPAAGLIARADLPPQLAYKAEVWTDARAGVITHADASPVNQGEQATTLGAIRRQRDAFGLPVASVALDKAYGQGYIYRGLERLGVVGYVPHPRQVNATSGPGLFGLTDFVYEAARNVYRCPGGRELGYVCLRVKWPTASHIWRAKPSDCGCCRLRAQCSQARGGRSLQVSIYQPEYARVDLRLQGQGARLAAIARSTGPEARFAQGKRWQGLARAKYRGLRKVAGQVLLTAAAQNLKKLVKWSRRQTGGAGRLGLTHPLPEFALSPNGLSRPLWPHPAITLGVDVP